MCCSTQVNGLWAQGRITCWMLGEHRMEPAYSRFGHQITACFLSEISGNYHEIAAIFRFIRPNCYSTSIFSPSFFVSSLKSRPRCWAAIYPWMTSTLSLDQGTRRQPYTRSSIKNAETKKGHFSFLTRPVRSWRLSRVAQKKQNCGKSDLRSTIALLSSAEMQKGDSISARLTGAALAQWTGRNILDFVSLLLVNADNWDQTRGPDLGKAGIGFEWDQLIWRTIQPDIRSGKRLKLVKDHSD